MTYVPVHVYSVHRCLMQTRQNKPLVFLFVNRPQAPGRLRLRLSRTEVGLWDFIIIPRLGIVLVWKPPERFGSMSGTRAKC
jgi:hypothetical protein